VFPLFPLFQRKISKIFFTRIFYLKIKIPLKGGKVVGTVGTVGTTQENQWFPGLTQWEHIRERWEQNKNNLIFFIKRY
jgi:hypothetical protein